MANRQHREHVELITSASPGFTEVQRMRMRRYAWVMGTCVTLILLAWTVVRLWSTDLAVAMSLVAMVLPPIAVMVANAGVD